MLAMTVVGTLTGLFLISLNQLPLIPLDLQSLTLALTTFFLLLSFDELVQIASLCYWTQLPT